MDEDMVSMFMAYTATWNWQILALMFLSFSLLCLALPRDLLTQVFYVAFFLIFLACEYMSLKRKGEVYFSK